MSLNEVMSYEHINWILIKYDIEIVPQKSWSIDRKQHSIIGS